MSKTKVNKPTVSGVGYIGVGRFNITEHKSIYTRWTGMLQRCYGKTNTKYYKDKGITVCKEWHNFQNFAIWVVEQPNYNKEGFQLDKDLKILDSKVYSPETCSFTPCEVNNIFHVRFRNRYENLPEGVIRKGKKYKAYSHGVDSFELRDTIIEAFEDYKQYVESYIKTTAKTYFDLGDICISVYENLINFKVPEGLSKNSKMFRGMVDTVFKDKTDINIKIPIKFEINKYRDKNNVIVQETTLLEELKEVFPRKDYIEFYQEFDILRRNRGNNYTKSDTILTKLLTEGDIAYYKDLAQGKIFWVYKSNNMLAPHIPTYSFDDKRVADEFKYSITNYLQSAMMCDFNLNDNRLTRLGNEICTIFKDYEITDIPNINSFSTLSEYSYYTQVILKSGKFKGEVLEIRGLRYDNCSRCEVGVVLPDDKKVSYHKSVILVDDSIRNNLDCVVNELKSTRNKTTLVVGDRVLINSGKYKDTEATIVSITHGLDDRFTIKVKLDVTGRNQTYGTHTLTKISN